MSGSGIPPEWGGRNAYYEDPRVQWLDSSPNRNMHRSNPSPGRTFGTSPYGEDRMQMSAFPYHPGFDDFNQFPINPMSMGPWPDFESEFRHSRPHTPNSATGGRRIPIQVVKHPVTVIPSSNAPSQEYPSHTQGMSEKTPPSQIQAERYPRQQRPTLSTSSLTSYPDPTKWYEWYPRRRVPSEEHVSYQNSGTAPINLQDSFVSKDGASSTSDTDSNPLVSQSKPVKVHHIAVSKRNEPTNQTKHNDFASLKPSVDDGTAIPLHYQSLPNRLFPMAHDMSAYSGAPSQTVPPDRPRGESEVSTPTKATASQLSASKPSPTPSEQIDKALAELTEIRSQIDAFSSSTKDKTYLYLEDRLDKLLLKFDEVETGGDDVVRQKRKQAVQETLDTISLLEKKLASTAENATTGNSVDKTEGSDNTSQTQPETPSLSEPRGEQQGVQEDELAAQTTVDAPVPSNQDEAAGGDVDNHQEPIATVEPANN